MTGIIRYLLLKFPAIFRKIPDGSFLLAGRTEGGWPKKPAGFGIPLRLIFLCGA